MYLDFLKEKKSLDDSSLYFDYTEYYEFAMEATTVYYDALAESMIMASEGVIDGAKKAITFLATKVFEILTRIAMMIKRLITKVRIYISKIIAKYKVNSLLKNIENYKDFKPVTSEKFSVSENYEISHEGNFEKAIKIYTAVLKDLVRFTLISPENGVMSSIPIAMNNPSDQYYRHHYLDEQIEKMYKTLGKRPPVENPFEECEELLLKRRDPIIGYTQSQVKKSLETCKNFLEDKNNILVYFLDQSQRILTASEKQVEHYKNLSEAEAIKIIKGFKSYYQSNLGYKEGEEVSESVIYNLKRALILSTRLNARMIYDASLNTVRIILGQIARDIQVIKKWEHLAERQKAGEDISVYFSR